MKTTLHNTLLNEPKNSSHFRPFFQPRLSINQPNDIYEQEADAMADKVMRMSDAAANNNLFFKPSLSSLQRKCAHCEEEEKLVQRKKENSDTPVTNTSTENYFNSLNGKGRSLMPHERSFYESRFGYDFSNVQLHTNKEAGESAKGINALAYTHGNHIIFGSNQYQPNTENGKKLMAHELTHVVQQNNLSPQTSIQRFATSDCNTTQTPLISNALTTAQSNLRTVITQLRTRPLSADIENALWIYFRDTGTATADTVANNLERIQTGISGLTYECENDCAENQLGYTRLGAMITGWGNIHLCMNNLGSTASDIANTIIHESAHYILFAGDTSGYYGNDCEETDETVSAGASSKLDLADSYSCIVKNWINGNSVDRTNARGDISGANFAGISQSPAGIIDLNGTSIRRPLFAMRLTRGPAAIVTGVSYRWIIRDSQDRSYLMTNIDGNSLFEFTPALNSVLSIINMATRNLLKQRAITSGRVLCRAESSVFGNRLFEIPVTFTF